MIEYEIQYKYGIPSRNPMKVEKGSLFVLASNTQAFFTASFHDFRKIAPYRWRIFDSNIISTMPSNGNGYERTVYLPFYLTGKTRDEKLTYLDGNVLNVSRDNVTGHHMYQSPSLITQHGRTATLHLNDGINVRFDSKFIELADRFTWYAAMQRLPTKTNIMVRASAGDGKIFFHRLLLNLTNQEFRHVKVRHKNNDTLDCRLSNMQTYSGYSKRNSN